MDNKIDQRRLVEEFKALIDETIEPVIIMGVTFNRSRILEELDPVCFYQEYLNYLSNYDIDVDNVDNSYFGD